MKILHSGLKQMSKRVLCLDPIRPHVERAHFLRPAPWAADPGKILWIEYHYYAVATSFCFLLRASK